ncbi:MAG: glycosyltransferase family 4 protein [Candidatus Omnitrophica bacterium]|nr:glycosyltransferase family 4 protein [Candidatus Omnitrophota bacterium]
MNDVKPDLVFSFNGGYPGGYSCLDMILEAAEHNITRYLCAVSTPTRIKWSERILYGKIKEAVDVVIVNSKSIKEALMFKRKFSEAKIQVVYTPIHKNQNGADPETFLRAINISRDKSLKIVGYSGRIEAAKGVFYLVQAFAELAAKHKDARLILVGSGRDTVRLKNYIKQLRMEKAVILPGYYGGSINDVLSALDLYVFPSLWEGLPYALLEAMAAQKIIVSTNVGGIPEAIDDHKEGLLVPPADVGALKEAMDQILSDIEGCRHWGRNAKLKAETVFSYDHFILRMNAALSLRAL